MRKAFTLVELLVVITVIAILMAVAFPVFVRAQKRAKQTACANNLKQLGTAIACYTQDWDDRFPWAWDDNHVIFHNKRPSLRDVLEPYVRTTDIWRCPSDTGEVFLTDTAGYSRHTPPLSSMAAGSSYAWDGLGWLIQTQLGGRPVSAIRSPSRGVLLSELRPWHGNYKSDEMWTESSAKYVVLHFDGHIDTRNWWECTTDEWYGLYEPTQ